MSLLLRDILDDAQYVFKRRKIERDSVQCGVTHAGFAKWLWYKYGLNCEFRHIPEKELPSHYSSSTGLDDESFLLLRDVNILIDICATPTKGPYVGTCIYDLSKSYLWGIDFRGPKKEWNDIKSFFDNIHWIELSCPREFKDVYPLFWRC